MPVLALANTKAWTDLRFYLAVKLSGEAEWGQELFKVPGLHNWMAGGGPLLRWEHQKRIRFVGKGQGFPFACIEFEVFEKSRGHLDSWIQSPEKKTKDLN